MAIPWRVRWAEWVAGLFVLATFAAIVVALAVLTRAHGTMSGYTTLVATLDNGHGIAPGGPVKMLGIPIGTIDTVEITEDNRVRATLEIADEYAARISADSVARVEASFGLESMLAGVGFEVTPGPVGAAALQDGDALRVAEPDSIVDFLPGMADDPMVGDLQATLRNVRRLTDQLADEDSELRRVLVAAGNLLEQVEKGGGTVGKVLRDDGVLYDELITTMHEAQTTLADAKKLMARSGKLFDKSGKLIDDTSDVVADAGGVMKSADTMVTTATDVFGKMDPVMEDAGDAMKNLDEAVVEFAKTTEELGRLIGKMDEVIADMATVTAAAKKVWPIRRHVRKSEEK